MTMRFGESISFTKTMVNRIVEDRLIDIFEHEKKLRLQVMKRNCQEGVVLTGGGAMHVELNASRRTYGSGG